MIKNSKKNKTSSTFFLGVALLVIACLLWLSVLVVPFLSLSSAMKATVVASILIIGEVAFWLGAILTGKEFVSKYKKYLNPKNWKSRQ